MNTESDLSETILSDSITESNLTEVESNTESNTESNLIKEVEPNTESNLIKEVEPTNTESNLIKEVESKIESNLSEVESNTIKKIKSNLTESGFTLDNFCDILTNNVIPTLKTNVPSNVPVELKNNSFQLGNSIESFFNVVKETRKEDEDSTDKKLEELVSAFVNMLKTV